MRRCRCAFFAALLAVLSPPAPRGRATELKRLYYGTTASPAQLPVWVAKDAGLFAQHGLDVEPIHVRGGSLITLAIITGDLPFSGVGAESVVAARVAGADVVLLACPIDMDPVYLITRPEIRSPQELRGHAAGITRFGSSTHFYLRAALKHLGLDPDRDVMIMQLGAGPEMVAALEVGRIQAAALTTRYAIPFLERGWPMLVELSKTDLVYPGSCVTSSRWYIRKEPKTTEEFLSAYVAAIHLIKRDPVAAERSFAKWLREKDAAIVKKSVAAYGRLFKTEPFVPDKGIENVVRDLMGRRPGMKEYLGWPQPFRENEPLERVLRARAALNRPP